MPWFPQCIRVTPVYLVGIALAGMQVAYWWVRALCAVYLMVVAAPLTVTAFKTGFSASGAGFIAAIATGAVLLLFLLLGLGYAAAFHLAFLCDDLRLLRRTQPHDPLEAASLCTPAARTGSALGPGLGLGPCAAGDDGGDEVVCSLVTVHRSQEECGPHGGGHVALVDKAHVPGWPAGSQPSQGHGHGHAHVHVHGPVHGPHAHVHGQAARVRRHSVEWPPHIHERGAVSAPLGGGEGRS
ncbi:hypothetical protein HYH03_003478 [Edaphochlamys debaryana]|uniref:Uncharacterized protein n=1 Tax=Edaphochlamys debaryana TaxID=47281 RepID=A0A835Y9W1_9CHLO|nr:hypothetical protein HYH03_003478 [Edaphochlamys debaryana]|eukprot:KAG2498738.1 hypothetical protein HYH03_003478 [Edaphochlamys debaryana]